MQSGAKTPCLLRKIYIWQIMFLGEFGVENNPIPKVFLTKKDKEQE
jgi:hypothetical protein